MSDVENLNNAFSTALYKKLNNKLVPLSEKINELELETQNISLTPGPKGSQGERGPQGIKGNQGIRGVQGKHGLIGEQGPQGLKGELGEQGLQGTQGIQGEKGDTGLQGDRGDTGNVGLQGIQGEKGEQGIQGDKGEKGDIGVQGIQGFQGDRGVSGKDGIKGDKGDQGLKGDQGAQGIQGEKGDKGDVGPKGDRGEQGAKGDTGATGEAGEVPNVEKIIEPLFDKAKDELTTIVQRNSKEINTFKSTINNQVSSYTGGGGSSKLKNLVDVDSSSAKIDGNFLKYDGSTKKWIGVDLIAGAPEQLDTLNELASALTDDTNLATGIVDLINTKAPKDNPSFTSLSTFNGTVKLPTANRSFTKQRCYNKTGGIRLQKATSDADEMIMRYEGVDSNNFVIEQYKDHDNTLTGQATTHGRKSQIKFLGTQNVLRLGGGNYVELGRTRTIGNFDIGVPTTESALMLKLAFRDSRTQEHGLHFEHSGTDTQTIQMGMYGDYPNADKGDFKITSKIGANAVQDILTIDNASQSLTLHKNVELSTGNLTLRDVNQSLDKTITASANNLTFASVHGIFGYSIGLRGNRGSVLGMESGGTDLDISAPGDITLTPTGGDVSVTGNIQASGTLSLGSTPAYSPTRSIKLFDNGVQYGARVSLMGTGDSAGQGLEMVTDGNLSKRTIIRHEGEGSNDYGLALFTTSGGNVAERFRFSGDGELGIGTPSPTEALDVVGNITTNGNISMTAGSGSQINLQGDTIIDFDGDLSIDGGYISFGSTNRISIETSELLQPDGNTALSWSNSGVVTTALSVTNTLTVGNMLNVTGDIEADGAEFGIGGGSVEFGGQATFNDHVEFQQSVEFYDEVDCAAASLINLTELELGDGNFSVDTNVLLASGSLNKVGINHTPVAGSSALHVNGNLTVEEGGEKGLFIQQGNYEYKIGDIDGGDVGTHLEINAAAGQVKFHNSSIGINKTPSSGIELDVSGDATISGTITSEGALIIQGDFESESTLDLVGGTGINATGTIETTDTVTAKGYSLNANTFTVVSTTSTLAASTNGLTVILQNTGPITITLPTRTAGHVTTFISETSNDVTFVGDTGVTVNSFNGANTTAGQFAQCQVIYKTSTIAFLGGNIV